MGVEPHKLSDVFGLCGDKVDDIPGVPGIGLKTAIYLMQRYTNIEEVIERVSEIESFNLRTKLIQHKELAFLSRRLFQIIGNIAPVPEEIGFYSFNKRVCNIDLNESNCSDSSQADKTVANRLLYQTYTNLIMNGPLSDFFDQHSLWKARENWTKMLAARCNRNTEK